jgi:hypothetical protein
MPDDVDVADRTVHVADNVDEFVERTRLQQIHEAKQKAADALREASYEAKVGDPVAAREYARGAVEMYVLEVESLYKQTDYGRELWARAQLGEVPLREAAPGLEFGDVEAIKDVDVTSTGERTIRLQTADRRPTGVSEDRPPQLEQAVNQRPAMRTEDTEIESAEIFVDGVGTYIDGLSGTAQVTVERDAAAGWAHSTETATMSAQLSPPLEVSREAYRATNALLSQSDVGVKLLDGDEGEAEFDTEYRDESDDG